MQGDPREAYIQSLLDRIEQLERALRQHACDCETCERTPEDRDDSCAANAALKGAATTEFVNVAGDVDHLIAEARREALEEAAQIISPPAGTSPNIVAVLEAAQRAIRALKEG